MLEQKEIALQELKDMINRLAKKNYSAASEKKDNATEITWGEYFEREILETHKQKSTEEFAHVIKTIMFDLIAAILIFAHKPAEFFAQVEKDKCSALAKDYDDWNIFDQDAVHLGILKNYFEEMQLDIEKLNSQDFNFFQEYSKLSRAS